MTQESIKQYIAKFHPKCVSTNINTIIECTPLWDDQLFINLYIMSMDEISESTDISPIQSAMDNKRPIQFINHLVSLGYDLTITRLSYIPDKHFTYALENLDIETEVILGMPDILYYRADVQEYFNSSDADVELLHCPDGDIKKLYTRVKRLVSRGYKFLPADYTKVKQMPNTTSDDLHNFAPLIHHSFGTIVQLPKIQLIELLKQIVNQLEYL